MYRGLYHNPLYRIAFWMKYTEYTTKNNTNSYNIVAEIHITFMFILIILLSYYESYYLLLITRKCMLYYL